MAGDGRSGSVDPEISAQLDAARELLGMELAFLGARHGRYELYRAAEGDAVRFGVEPGDIVPLDSTICPTADVGAPVAIEDTGRGGLVRSCICAPVWLPGDRLFGRLGCVSAHPVSPLGERELRLMQVLARLVGERIEAGRAAEDRMTSDRPYRRALRHEEAVHELQRGRGTQFCPHVVDALVSKVHGAEEPLAVPA